MVLERNNNGLCTVCISFLAGRNFQYGYPVGTANLCNQILHNGSQTYRKKDFIRLPMQVGGTVNSGVNDLFSTFTIRGLDDEIENILNLLYSLVYEPSFNDLDKQKKIVRELNTNTMNDPFKILLDRLNDNFLDTKFTRLQLDRNFNSIDIETLKSFYNMYYNSPAITISSGYNIDSISSIANDIESKFHINKTSHSINYDYYSVKERFLEFNWKVTTNNRILLYFIVDNSSINDILASIYQYKINKSLRMDKAICCRNRCIILPHGLDKSLFTFDLEFSDYNNKDIIIDSIFDIITYGFSNSEFEISKKQKIGSLMYDACDPIKLCIFDSQNQFTNMPLYNDYINELKSFSYRDALNTKLNNYGYVLGTNKK